MLYKPDWDMTKKRFEAFWNREILDRCMVAVTARKDHPVTSEYPPLPSADLVARWTDPDYIIPSRRRGFEKMYYGGDAFPVIQLNLGASGHAGFFKGSKFQFAENTVWFFKSLNNPRELEFDRDSFLYRKHLELARALAEDSRGDYIISMPDTTGNADALSHLLGPERMFECFLEDKDAAKEALDKIEYAYEEIQRDAYSIVKDVNYGGACVGWLDVWAPGFLAQMQSDMSVMISKPMFDEFVMPELTRQSEFLDFALYHLDGIEQRRHLDSLLSLPRLRCIQWTQVVGHPPATEFIPELKRIQQAGKCLLISVSPGQIEPLMKELSSRGLYLLTWAATEDDAREIVKNVTKWTHE